VNTLTVEEVLVIHQRLIQRTGGSGGLRDLGLLESAVARPHASFAGEDLYPDLWSKAAALMHSLIKNHPFVDGNKRTAITAAGIFLALNGHALRARNEELAAFTERAATGAAGLAEIATWLQVHSRAAG
jgi:death-on-curing protein